MFKRFKLFNIKGFNQLKILVYGSTTSFLINVIALLIYSRLYSTEQIGIYALFVSIISIGAIIATFRLENIIVLQKTKKEAAFISYISNYIILIFSLVILVFALLLIGFSTLFFNSSSYIWFFIPIAIYSFANVNVFLSWNNKIKNYKLISIYRFIHSSLIGILIIILGYYKVEQGLIIGYTIGVFVAFGFLMIRFRSESKKLIINNIKFSDIINVLQSNKDIINSSYGLGFLQTVARFLPNFILNHFYGSSIVGIYDITIKILNIPKNIISSNIGELYYQKATVFYSKRNFKFKKISYSTSGLLFLIALGCYLPFFIFGPDLFVLILGEKWRVSGELSSIVSVWYLIYFVTSPMAYIFYIKRNLSQLFWFSFITFLIKIIILVYFATLANSIRTIKIYIVASAILEFILLVIILFSCKLPNKIKQHK